MASLDPVTAKQVMDDFQRINRDMHITVLINIHHVELALQYATRVIGIRAGEIVYDGPANQVDQAVLTPSIRESRRNRHEYIRQNLPTPNCSPYPTENRFPNPDLVLRWQR